MPLPVLIPQIQAEWWSPKLRNHGKILEDADDINQAIAIILTTPKGTDPHRPEFASDLNNWIDQPINIVTPHLVREIYESVLRWEPRIDVINVAVQPYYLNELARVGVSLEWRLKESETGGRVEVRF